MAKEPFIISADFEEIGEFGKNSEHGQKFTKAFWKSPIKWSTVPFESGDFLKVHSWYQSYKTSITNLHTQFNKASGPKKKHPVQDAKSEVVRLKTLNTIPWSGGVFLPHDHKYFCQVFLPRYHTYSLVAHI